MKDGTAATQGIRANRIRKYPAVHAIQMDRTGAGHGQGFLRFRQLPA